MNVAPPGQLRDLEEKLFGARVVTGFGMTEVAGSMALSDPEDPIERRVLPGLALHGAELEVRDIVDGSRAPAGAEGEIVLRGSDHVLGIPRAPRPDCGSRSTRTGGSTPATSA